MSGITTLCLTTIFITCTCAASLPYDSGSSSNSNKCLPCGQVPMKTGKSVGVERIVGGRVTEARQHPWVGGLVWQGALEVWCGGVLVSSSLLLTAAHCAQRILPGESHAEVIFLSTSPEKDEEAEAQIRRTIVEIKIHPDYDPLSLKHDLALMWLEEEEEEVVEEVVVESEVVPVCFPDGDKDYANYTGVVAGWGRIEEGGPLSQDLREVEIPILSNEVCSRLYPPGMIDNTVLCAGDTNKDACQVTISKADSGGPLVVMEEGVGVVLVGVVSWGRGCGRPNQPGVYVRVTEYLPWIGKEKNRRGSCNYLSTLPLPPPTPPPPPSDHLIPCECGLTNYTRQRVVGGTHVKVHEYPWQAAIVGYYQITPFCGGVLVSPRWVLTAAHCTHEMHHDDQVLLGEHKWNTPTETQWTIRRKVAEILVHPNFSQLSKMDSDIALLRLNSPVPLGPQRAIVPICLPASDEDFTGHIGTVSGWGSVSSYGFVSSVLKATHVPILSEEECVSVFGTAAFTQNMICAGVKEGGKDACQGDSGGPLSVLSEGRRWVLAGLVSWGRGCGRPSTPGVYVKVAGYVNWIKNITGASDTCGER